MITASMPGCSTRRSDSFVRTSVDWPPVSLTIGIVGLPNVGKSTLFNALTKNDVLAANYPFATIDPNVGVVGVPDPRLDVLAKLFSSAKTVPATVSFVDIAGIVRGASTGEGLGNKFLANIREADAICQVIRAFSDPNVVHVDGKVSPADDIETINTELILADLQTIENALPRLQKEARLQKDKRRSSRRPSRPARCCRPARRSSVRARPRTAARAAPDDGQAVPLRRSTSTRTRSRTPSSPTSCARSSRRPRRSSSTRRPSPS